LDGFGLEVKLVVVELRAEASGSEYGKAIAAVLVSIIMATLRDKILIIIRLLTFVLLLDTAY
jgi:hypothetical protein